MPGEWLGSLLQAWAALSSLWQAPYGAHLARQRSACSQSGSVRCGGCTLRSVHSEQSLQGSYDPQPQIVADDQQDRQNDDGNEHDDEGQLDQAGARTLIVHQDGSTFFLNRDAWCLRAGSNPGAVPAR